MKHHYSMLKPQAICGVQIILKKLGNVRRGETVCIVSDQTTARIGDAFAECAFNMGLIVYHHKIIALKMHGQEPPAVAAKDMMRSQLIIGLTKNSMAHTKARLSANAAGGRYLSLPDYSESLLCHGALRLDYKKAGLPARHLAEAFSKGRKVEIRSCLGTSVTLGIKGRSGNFCPGYVTDRFQLGSPPDIEANVAPVESESNGFIVVDGSIPYAGFGKLTDPVFLHVKNGKIGKIEGDLKIARRLKALFDAYGPRSRILAELGVGFNKKAFLCGNMLMDEGAYGTFHFGFGSNFSIGGRNAVPFHIDCVCRAGEILIDGRRVINQTESFYE